MAAPAPVAPKAAAPIIAAPEATRPAADPNAAVAVTLDRAGDNLLLHFPFVGPTPAAVFRRADTLWLVFDGGAKIDLAALSSDSSHTIRSAVADLGKDGENIVRIRLERPRLASLTADGPGWIVTLGDTITEPTRPLGIARSIVGPNRASIAIPFGEPRQIHRLTDPDFGDRLMVVTALGPARGFLKPQDFVELRALASTHGVVVQPLADDITAELSADKIVISRPGGLTLSAAALDVRVPGSFRSLMFDTQLWGFDREAKFSARQAELIRLAASAPEARRNPARLNLARFYLSRDMSAEAKAVLDVALADHRAGGDDDVTGVALKAVANVMLDRPDDALKDLANPQIGNQYDAPIWRAIAYARQGKWAEAREGFKSAEGAMAALPIELQRMAMREAVRSSIEVRDFNGAAKMLNDFETLGVPPEMESSIQVLTGRLNEGLGRSEEALNSYRAAAESRNRRMAAQGHLREIELRYSLGDIPSKDMIDELETLTTVWRGDETEVEGLKLLAHLYTEGGRYRNAFHTMRMAMMAHPNSDLTRKIQDEAAVTFDSLFLAGKGDSLPPIEALGLFYDYRELTPIGRRGDEMIRKLVDRLVAVDLLDQAAELLQHQVDHRLQGAARAQVATRLAVIYLMHHKPDRALATLQSTRTTDLSNELRDQRLLLEARALSDIGRHEVALEVIASLNGREAIRLRSDILWAAKRWNEASEQIELLYGERWRDFTPLTEGERADILRAAIGYALAEEPISLQRFRDKYAAKMTDGADHRAFDIVSGPIGTNSGDFQDVAKTVASVDTLGAFLSDMRARYPDSAALPPGPPPADPQKPQAAAPKPVAPVEAANAVPKQPAPASSPLPPRAPQGVPLKPDPAPTGSIPRLPKPSSIAR
jgi:tetratricopeptide (TPR) repeat protein